MVYPSRRACEPCVASSRPGRVSYERGEEKEKQSESNGPDVHVQRKAESKLHEAKLKRKVGNAEMKPRPHEGVVCSQYFTEHGPQDGSRNHKSYRYRSFFSSHRCSRGTPPRKALSSRDTTASESCL